jgi:hypothetical protein
MTGTTSPTDCSPAAASKRGAFRPTLTIGLAALGAPRVILHDLEVVDESDAVNLVLVAAPLLAWVVAAVVTRVPNPLRALTWVGAAYGAALAVTHQLLWDRAFEDDPPRLGGNVEGELSAGAEELLLRCFAVASSLATGLVLGALCGLVARALSRRSRP